MLLWRRSESVPLAFSRVRCRAARLLKGQQLSEADARRAHDFEPLVFVVHKSKAHKVVAHKMMLPYTQVSKIESKSSERSVRHKVRRLHRGERSIAPLNVSQAAKFSHFASAVKLAAIL